mmetsp:Transcript_5422/g.20248  ORF Transcript_5422/g.20248 Transcript_5422/m.20248 type:complete len:105 (-) Transcript_5422:1580-1894(-)
MTNLSVSFHMITLYLSTIFQCQNTQSLECLILPTFGTILHGTRNILLGIDWEFPRSEFGVDRNNFRLFDQNCISSGGEAFVGDRTRNWLMLEKGKHFSLSSFHT